MVRAGNGIIRLPIFRPPQAVGAGGPGDRLPEPCLRHQAKDSAQHHHLAEIMIDERQPSLPVALIPQRAERRAGAPGLYPFV
ncbi:hypothetical protein HPB47_010210 [Ixodes persulcatus]|uniref:Uncharacterized protein n=1 Tax=Ixodes persulcatus TaxID=34615 RepID=A0AC60NZM7_IXOPE|nr:hypothetical protein HPB47_010210 [Ixodes persulcatus]